jgi:uncharacterized membrane protein YhaH (DUF805 family)
VQAYGFNLLHVLFSFQGRLRRQHFWIGWLICLGVGAALSWIPLLGWMLSIALIWPNLAIAVKRLHDMGQSGWLIAIPLVAGMVGLGGMIVTFFSAGLLAADGSGPFETQDPAAIASVFGPALGFVALSFLIQLGFLLWIGCSDSQRAENRFGPDSKVDYRAWAWSRPAR